MVIFCGVVLSDGRHSEDNQLGKSLLRRLWPPAVISTVSITCRFHAKQPPIIQSYRLLTGSNASF